ncbi:hypothetical protein C8233_03595 [Halomonas sp. SF2003]|nr:hypothetical protein C8233_03595 [Halomonas sp. SF2003]
MIKRPSGVKVMLPGRVSEYSATVVSVPSRREAAFAFWGFTAVLSAAACAALATVATPSEAMRMAVLRRENGMGAPCPPVGAVHQAGRVDDDEMKRLGGDVAIARGLSRFR